MTRELRARLNRIAEHRIDALGLIQQHNSFLD